MLIKNSVNMLSLGMFSATPVVNVEMLSMSLFLLIVCPVL